MEEVCHSSPCHLEPDVRENGNRRKHSRDRTADEGSENDRSEEKRMLADLKPLVPYLKRYRRGFFWGGVSVVLSNGIWILLPLVIGRAIDALKLGVTQQKILHYAGLIVAGVLCQRGRLFFSRRGLLRSSRGPRV